MNIKHLPKFIIICCITLVAGTIVAAQQVRSITSDDFVKSRPSAPAAAGGTGVSTYPFGKKRSKRKAPKYLSRPAKKLIHKPVLTAKAKTIIDIGVTIWKLRPPLATEKGAFLLPVKMDNDERKMWLAERVDADTVFKAGDKVRFAVESFSAGYLYVFNRETHSDGTFGNTNLIFPYSLNDDNSVHAGMLVDIPDQNEKWPYFNMKAKHPLYSGEMVTVIISPKRLTNINVDANSKLQNGEVLADLESGSDAELYKREDMGDKIYSKTESASSCGVKKRELEREEKSGKPCGVNSRELTREDPKPQSIYRVTGVEGQPAVALLKLAVRQ